MLPQPLTNFEIKKYYQKEPKFNDVYSRNNLCKIKDGAYIINLDEYESIVTHCITLYVNAKNITYFDCFTVEYILKEIKTCIGNKNMITIIYRTQAYDSIMCGHFYVSFIDFMLKSKSLSKEHTNLFSPNEYNEYKIFSIESN